MILMFQKNTAFFTTNHEQKVTEELKKLYKLLSTKFSVAASLSHAHTRAHTHTKGKIMQDKIITGNSMFKKPTECTSLSL